MKLADILAFGAVMGAGVLALPYFRPEIPCIVALFAWVLIRGIYSR